MVAAPAAATVALLVAEITAEFRSAEQEVPDCSLSIGLLSGGREPQRVVAMEGVVGRRNFVGGGVGGVGVVGLCVLSWGIICGGVG